MEINKPRSTAAVIAVIGWWVAAICAVAAWYLLNSENATGIQVGTWLIGFAALGSLAGWGASIGSLLRDRGRIRIGAALLLALPFVSVAFAVPMMRSTVVNPTDPLPAVWGIVCGLLLVIATLLVIAPQQSR